MLIGASDVAVHYVELTTGGEWLMAAYEWQGRPGVYRWRLVRLGVILIDGGFNLKPGQTIGDHLLKACEEFRDRRPHFEKLFHSNNREMGVRMPPFQTRGTTPFNCAFGDFQALIMQWRYRVPNKARRKDFRVFEKWAAPQRALLVS
jgi:hypothetical protein